MAQFRYPGTLNDKHPVITRISILERFNILGDVVQDGLGPVAQQFAGITGVDDVAAEMDSKENKKKVKDIIQSVSNRQTITAGDDPIHQIYLYAPSSIQFADGLQYDNQELGIIAGTIFAAADAATDSGGQNAVEKTLSVGAGLAAGLFSEIGKRSGFSQQGRLNSGVARNPRTEMLFRTPSMRQLSLTWKLMPNNRQESAVVYEMIQTMRKHAYPSIGNTGEDFAFAFPDVFKIEFVSRGSGKARMIQLAQAYCTAVNTTYGASGPAFFDGGDPVEIDLTMTFQETTIQTRESLAEGGF